MNKSLPLFTVVVPIYNSASTILETISSVVNQTFSNWELVLVDDESTDETLQLVAQVVASDARIKLFERPLTRVKGANTCRNIGIENAKGQFIAFLDSDDSWKEDRLKNVISFIYGHEECQALYSGAEIRDGYKAIYRGSRNIAAGESMIDFLLSAETFAPTPGLVVKAELAKRIMFDESLKRHQDYDFVIRLGKNYEWRYFHNFDVIVNWEKGKHRNVDFPSCIKFYKRYKNDITNSKNQFYYLFSMWKEGYETKSSYAVFYHKELFKLFFKVDWKLKVLALIPKLWYLRHHRGKMKRYE